MRGLAVLLLLAVSVAPLVAQQTLAARLDKALKDAGIPIVGVSIGDASDKKTWKVDPPIHQKAAQPIIDAFDPTPPAYTPPPTTTVLQTQLDALTLRVTAVELATATWKGIFVDADAPGTDDAVWVRHTTTPVATYAFKVRKGNVTRTLATVSL